MYQLAIRRDFTAHHFLIGGDWGRESHLHPHEYSVEVRVDGTELNEHGYLIDIMDMENRMGKIISYFKDRTLNDLPEFAGMNPSIERLAGCICEMIGIEALSPALSGVTVKVWEAPDAWAACRRDFYVRS